ncbi:MAG: TRAP transporter substrate-binding protein [Dehalococcoidales bacterium]|nr:TRAP transporter substrate-binding protein [Dehalococcoidales bacterium]
MIKCFLAVVILAGIILNGCSAAGPVSTERKEVTADTGKTWNLKYAIEQTPTSYYYLYGHVPYTRSVEEATGGRVKITIYDSQTLMKSNQNWEGVDAGIADMAWLFTGLYPGQFSIAEVSTLPYIFPDAATGAKVSWQMFCSYPEIQARFKDVKVLAVWTTEPYFIVSRSKFYKTLDDFQGEKMRAGGGPPTDFVKAMGASPMLLSMPDCYLNLQRGVFDAMPIPAEAYVSFSLYEVAPYVTYVSTVAMYQALIMNLDTWNSFPTEVQEQIMSVSGETASVMMSRDVFDRAKREMKDRLEKAGGSIREYTVPSDEVQRWIEKGGKPVWDEWVRTQEAAGLTRARQILDDTMALTRQYSPGES